MPASHRPTDPAPLPPRDSEAARGSIVGPILYFRGCVEDRLELAALLVCSEHEGPPVVRAEGKELAPETLHRRSGLAVLRYEFSFSAANGGVYTVGGKRYQVAGITEDVLRIAYVSCNGQERGDRERALVDRNKMWRRLMQQHASEPLSLLLQGGDQLYADEMLDVHPAAREWADGATEATAKIPLPDSLDDDLREYLLQGYLELYRQPAPAWLLARVPSLFMWDDHDICDGWGSHSAERIDSPVGRAVFQAAREFFLLFQLGAAPDSLPSICTDRTGTTLTWMANLPGVRLIGPDLRSERRPDRVLGSAGWAALKECLAAPGDARILILSSVPVLGPRLSWVEAVMHRIPGAQKYEDDLRDQWQSHSHREEWRRLLRELLEVHQRGTSPITLLSGEIHLATRGTMVASNGPIHQLIASGITHPPPPHMYARLLGGLARLGEAPLAAHPIRLHPLPGQRGIYTAQRNYLLLERRAGRWTARWDLEHDGPTPPLEI